MNTKNRLQPQIRSVSDQPIQPIGADRQQRIKTLTGSAEVLAALLIGTCVGHAADLPRPGEAIDAGDSYQLKDGSRVALHRVVSEVAIKHLTSRSAEPTLREAGVNQDPLAPLVTIESGASNIVDVYQVEDSQAVDRLLNVQETEIAGFPVLMDPASRRRTIATDEIIVQFAGSVTASEAVALFNHGFRTRLMAP